MCVWERRIRCLSIPHPDLQGNIRADSPIPSVFLILPDVLLTSTRLRKGETSFLIRTLAAFSYIKWEGKGGGGGGGDGGSEMKGTTGSTGMSDRGNQAEKERIK